MNCGVYQIKHLASGRLYIGSSVNLRRRLAWHRQALRAGYHHSPKLQRAWDKYGEGAFAITVLLFCAPEMRHFYEQSLIDGLGVVEGGWNCSSLAHRPAVKATPESRAKLSASLRAAAKKYDWRGMRLCITEIAEMTGVSARLLDKRIGECGWSVERAVTEPKVEMYRKPEGFGREQSFAEWARELGCKESTLRKRYAAGETIEEFARQQKRITLGELAVLAGWAQPVVMRRIRCGWDVGDALFTPSNAGKRREFVRNAPCGGAREIAL